MVKQGVEGKWAAIAAPSRRTPGPLLEESGGLAGASEGRIAG
jgi:hypothetical protein